ncbi:MAG: exopolyphosphatase / guanosine-5-triphosphate,3-diphosphate pyrophosphatase [Actinomycetota bacterium]|nr:exopolyphosphatase / guanosine-5-triphosphate,3-diphosphate pyrophosphatase [Actinomycetota bacterium]
MTGLPTAPPVRVAALDCGTHSLRLLIADVDPATGTLTDVERTMEIVRLGEGVDTTGRLSPEALERTLTVTARYAERCGDLGAQHVRFVATSATRDAENREELVRGVRHLLGVDPEVISGEEEAALSFDGATSDLIARGELGPFLVVDLGGGSTELVLGDAVPRAVCSMQVGCVRLTERHLASDPPTPEQVRAALADADRALDAAMRIVPFQQARTLVGLSGTVTTATALALELPRYDPAAIHGAHVPAERMRQICRDLLAMTRADRVALPCLHPGRVDVIAGGALLWERIVDRVLAAGGVDRIVTSERDILDGLARSLARPPTSPPAR